VIKPLKVGLQYNVLSVLTTFNCVAFMSTKKLRRSLVFHTFGKRISFSNAQLSFS